MLDALVENATLTAQSYGIAMAQVRYGGPAGIWLECRGCQTNDVIVGSNTEVWAARPDADAVAVFKRHGWTGDGPAMKQALCPRCSQAKAQKVAEEIAA